jgi:uncharacterized membrane protein
MAEIPPKTTRQIIRSFEAKALKKRPRHERYADSLTIYIGSMSFLILNIVLFTFWILANLSIIPGLTPFDPFPFVFLITAVSIEAIILTTIVLMTQNRQSLISSLRNEIDLQVTLLVEREVTKILKLLVDLHKHLGMNSPEDPELDKMLKVTDISYIQRKLEEQLAAEQPKPLQQVVTKPLVKLGEAVEKTVKTAQENHKPNGNNKSPNR